MTQPKKENIYKGISVALLALIASSMIYLNTQFISFVNENTLEHKKIELMVSKEINYTHSIYKYEIVPNTARSKENRQRIVTLENK